MENNDLNIVTGAFGYTGKYIAQGLIKLGKRVRTLTRHQPSDNPFGNKIEIAPLNFNKPDELVNSLRGATTLYNTYWIRFPYGDMSYDKAISNSKTLIAAAKEAGIKRIIHISITNPSPDSPLPYFKGKALVEQAIIDSGLSYAFIRPTVIFGKEDILINNIAWFLKTFPVFAISGDGNYKIQPIYVEDVAASAIAAASQSENLIWDLAGSETFTFNELIRLIAEKIKSKSIILHLPPTLSLLFTKLMGLFLGDVILTREEIDGLISNLLISNNPHPAQIHFSTWLQSNSDTLGRTYTSELKRHYRLK